MHARRDVTGITRTRDSVAAWTFVQSFAASLDACSAEPENRAHRPSAEVTSNRHSKGGNSMNGYVRPAVIASYSITELCEDAATCTLYVF
jgi:hypothetical protein